MKQALLITAYDDFEILIKMITYYSQKFDCYLHIDKKASISRAEFDSIRALPNTWVIRKYSINWGSYKHIKAVLSLMKIAVSNEQYGFYHIITGNSCPIKSFEEFDSFFTKYSNHNFMELIPLENNPSKRDIEEWFYYYRFPFLYNKRGAHAEFWNQFEYYFVKLQKKLNVKRSVYYPYKGYFYCHLNHEFVLYVIKFLKTNPSYLKKLKYCHVCEEFFFQNIIMSSPFKTSVISSHLFFDIWSLERGNPAILVGSDYSEIMKSDSFFARKCNSSSISLIDKIMNSITE